jgi:hypothetical protein
MFGGFLASEMWAILFNQPEIRADEQLRDVMLAKGFNFESIFEHVLNSAKYSDAQRTALNTAMVNSYQHMDNAIYDYKLRSVSGIWCCQRFVDRFSQASSGRPFFFTLNQDIFIERFLSSSKSLVTIPGVHSPSWFNGRLGPSLSSEEFVTLPDERQLQKVKNEFWNKNNNHFTYVKLHGSYGWRAHDGSDVMVIGQGKEGRIEKEPLLKWYLSLFEESLNEGDKNLVVIGYGFGDDHINNIIAEAIRDRKLKLFVISPAKPQDFYLELTSAYDHKIRAHDIWKGLYGYYCGNALDFYSSDDHLPPLGRKLFSDLDLL